MDRKQARPVDDPTDATLVLAARSGEEWAAEALFLRHAPMVNKLAFHLAPRQAEVDDLVQDSFVQALDNLKRLRDPQAFAAWLKSIVVHMAAKKIRRIRVRAKLGLYHGGFREWEQAISGAAPPDVVAELHSIYSVLDRLPAECRVALILKRVEGLTIPDISSLMKLSEGTVKRRIRMADRLLKGLESAERSPS